MILGATVIPKGQPHDGTDGESAVTTDAESALKERMERVMKSSVIIAKCGNQCRTISAHIGAESNAVCCAPMQKSGRTISASTATMPTVIG